jgi:hypothetical protein
MRRCPLAVSTLLLMLAMSSCATAGSPVFEGGERTAEACDAECQLIVSNAVGRTVLISVYQDGVPRFVGAVDSGRSETFQVMRNLTSDRIVVVAELNGQDYCRGSVDLPPDRPARFTVGDRVDCKRRP